MYFFGLFSAHFSCEVCGFKRQQSAATFTVGVAPGSLLHGFETKEMSVFYKACVLLKSDIIYK